MGSTDFVDSQHDATRRYIPREFRRNTAPPSRCRRVYFLDHDPQGDEGAENSSGRLTASHDAIRNPPADWPMAIPSAVRRIT